MKDSVTKITLGVGCVVTALTLSTTCFLTVNAVLAYVRGDQPASLVREASAEPIVPAAIDSRRLSAEAPPQTAGVVKETASAAHDQHRPKVGAVRSPADVVEVSPQPAASTEPVWAPIPAAGSSGLVVEPASIRQDHATIADERKSAEESAVAFAGLEQQRCGEGSLASAICREVMRWKTCHPDGWNETPDCAVQQFEVFAQ